MTQKQPKINLDVALAYKLGLVKLHCPDCGSRIEQTYELEDEYWNCINSAQGAGECEWNYYGYIGDLVVGLGNPQ